ncbi:hypothetical protein GCM10012275_52740 [Longimycelium tulufanense]|uniref:Uncharacterized protein n=1 Tax=Longimycelium tulufanense TaxID=907463 RepID=A0A8J3CK92_9PSEU|nr:hypothetical protein [Longimycelium tulufanense]GGM75507.1 hypothetical protein GCM10012275_52740 [Longimycelium tulufanense]
MANTVTLVHPDGREYTTSATNTVEINDLMYGQGYRIREEPVPEARAVEAKPGRQSKSGTTPSA